MRRDGVYAVFRAAMEAGGRQLGPFEIEWDISGNCLLPVRRDITARKQQGVEKRGFYLAAYDRVEDTFNGIWAERVPVVTYGKERYGPYVVHLTAKCRRCDNCLAERRNLWARRAVQEMALASRTWFGTATLSPDWQVKFGALATREAERSQRETFEAMSPDRQLLARHIVIAREWQKAFKRLRKDGHAFRYLLVLEAHKSGLPHYHMLLHEVGAPISKRTLEAAWPYGFTKWKLADSSAFVWYAAKYLGKSRVARVRASLRYGESMPLGVAPRLEGGEKLTYHETLSGGAGGRPPLARGGGVGEATQGPPPLVVKGEMVTVLDDRSGHPSEVTT